MLAVLGTAAPFLVALAAGWVVVLVRRLAPIAVVTGVVLWAITDVGGLLLRRTVWDRGTAAVLRHRRLPVRSGCCSSAGGVLCPFARGRGEIRSPSPPLRGGPLDGGTVIKNLYVGNLPFSTTSDELANLFGHVGVVTSAQVITDRETGRSRGFGFVEMSDEDARKAINELTGPNLGGRSITVNEARPRAPRGGGGGSGGPRRDRY